MQLTRKCLKLILKQPSHFKTMVRHASRPISTFKFSDLVIETLPPNQRKQKPDVNSLVFGHSFSDHMFEVEYTENKGWGVPRIVPVHNLSLHPAAKVFHYAIELFEGMKAYRGHDNRVRMFRPDMNVKRMLASAERCALPLFDPEELLECMKKLVSIDQECIPGAETGASLYIRPTMIGIDPVLKVDRSASALLYVLTGPVGPYFKTGVKPVSLLADPRFVRAWPGGCGDKKMGSNYAPTIAVQKYAESKNFQQVLWLFGEDHQITEVGTMNLFMFIKNKEGEKELITAPLNGVILPGVTRDSVLQLAREWNEFKVTERVFTMPELVTALKENRVIEIFGAGTACVVCPVSNINYLDKDYAIPCDGTLSVRLLNAVTDIFYAKTPHRWCIDVDSVSEEKQSTIAYKN